MSRGYVGFPASQPLKLVDAGSITSGSAVQVVAAAHTAVAPPTATAPDSATGYLQLFNHGSGTLYLGPSTVDATWFPLAAGEGVVWYLRDVTQLYVYGSGAVLGWALAKEA